MLASKTRGTVKDPKVIQFQGAVVSAQSLEDAAKLSIAAQALEGTGPLASALKTASKEALAKFTKQNPDFTFTVLGRTIGTKNKPTAEKTGPKTDLPKATKKKVAEKKVAVPKKASKAEKKAAPVKKKAKK